MTSPQRRLATTALAAALVLGTPMLASCGGIAENAAEQAAEAAVGGDVDINDEGVTVTDDEGNEMAIGEGVSLPDTWPAEVPAFDGGTLSMVTVQKDGSANAMWQVDGTAEEAAAAYGATLEAAGYTSESTSNIEGMMGGDYTGNGYTVNVVSLAADNETTLMVTATKE